MDPKNVIEVQGLRTYLGGRWVHDNLNMTVKHGEIVAIIGGSGCGKTTLLRTILMLQKYKEGSIKIFDVDILKCTSAELKALYRRWGVMFQSGALFSSLTVLENVMYPLNEIAKLSKEMQKKVAYFKLFQAGLEIDAANKYPSELSGGMQKRVALARAMALDAEILFFDEPTAGLDPESAGELDELVLDLRKSLGITIVMVTHDLDTLWKVSDRVMFMGEGKILAAEKMSKLVKNTHPLIQAYFSGPRARTAEYFNRVNQDGATGVNNGE